MLTIINTTDCLSVHKVPLFQIYSFSVAYKYLGLKCPSGHHFTVSTKVLQCTPCPHSYTFNTYIFNWSFRSTENINENFQHYIKPFYYVAVLHYYENFSTLHPVEPVTANVRFDTDSNSYRELLILPAQGVTRVQKSKLFI